MVTVTGTLVRNAALLVYDSVLLSQGVHRVMHVHGEQKAGPSTNGTAAQKNVAGAAAVRSAGPSPAKVNKSAKTLVRPEGEG